MRRRLAVSLAVAGLFGAVSYGVQTLYAGWGAPPYAPPVLEAPIPFYWRVALVGYQAALLGLLCHLGLSEASCERFLSALPVLAPLLVLPLAVLMGVRP
jgi:hypothetical protein